MSHIVTIATEVRDETALQAACERLKLPSPVFAQAQLFSSEATGHCVRLPDWRYPVVCQLETGRIEYDNFEGRWGNPTELSRLIQRYSVEKAGIEARRQGHTLTEQQLADGSIKLTIQVGGKYEVDRNHSPTIR